MLVRTQEEWLADGAACMEAAIAYAAAGWSVLPLCPPDHVGVGTGHGKRCDNPGKAPLIDWAEFQGRAATADEIRLWWKRWANANVGVVMGAVSGMVGLDIDGPAGEEAWARVKASGRLPPPTAAFRTGGGRRLLFGVPAGLVVQIERVTLKGEHAEIRVLGEGSQTVVPPSRHYLGGYYEWATNDLA